MEFPFVSTSVETVHAALEVHGVALLRAAVPKARVLRFKAALEHVYATYDLERSAFARFDGAEAVGRGDVTPQILEHFSGLSFDQYFDAPKLTALAKFCLREPWPDLQTAMSVSPTLGKATQGFNLHTDGIIQGTDRAVIAFWSPLDDCGVDAPGLRVIPASRQRVIDYLRRELPTRQIPGWSSSTEWEATGAFREDILEREFGPPWAPRMEAGDVMVFSNWTIHGSYVTSEMSKPRSAIVRRWVAHEWAGGPSLLRSLLYKAQCATTRIGQRQAT